jgi:hypothetical protein
MALNLFGPVTKENIRVSYVDSVLGLIEDVSITQANAYARRNPGTTFIFRDGNQKIQYLNINQVNNLNPNILTPTDPCNGVSGNKEVGPPTIQFFGGNGIGAAGNPIIGTDGSLLAVDIVSGGYGYQYPPLVSVNDIGNNGSGATLISVLSEDILRNSATPSIFINELVTFGSDIPVTAGGTGGTPITSGGLPVTAGGTGGTPITSGGLPVTAGGTGGTPITSGGLPVTAGGTGGTPITSGGLPVTAGGTGGLPVTAGGTGGLPVTAGGTGGTPITSGGLPVTAGGTGGTPITSGGLPVTAGGTGGLPVTAGGTGGLPVTAGGTGGTPITSGGLPVTAGGTGGLPVTAGGTGGTPITSGGLPVTAGIIVPREVSGRGVVVQVIVTDPGNGYVTTTPPTTETLSTFPNPPSGNPTGINATFRPQFEVIRDPIVIDPQKLLQVTDLVGLKQTGYVNGRAYYGSVYYDNGIRYAGFYETVGEPVRVYDTLRESITEQVTTPPSAILRQGTDIRSNNPLFNIPGTIRSTLNSNSYSGVGDISTSSVPFIQEPTQESIYSVSLRLKNIIVENPGINYNVTDKIRITPSNGAVLEPVFGSFGRVIKVAIIDPGFGFTEYPRIEMFTPL